MTEADAAPPMPDAKRRMLCAALDLFHAKGIHATGVDEILERSGTGKSQLYHYFGSKDGLIEAVVQEFEQRLIRRETPGPAEIRSLKDLERWFLAFVHLQRDTGCERTCPMATVAVGLGPEQEAIRLRIEQVFLRARGILVSFFEELLRQKQLPPKTRPEELADFCFTVMQGGLVVARMRRDPEPFEHAVRHAMAYLRSLVR